jgi:predicted transposase/invertase (TIGR01784 family)
MEIKKVVYLCPKYVNDETPAPLAEWLRAIDDTLDTEVEESHYQHPQIQRVFAQIEQDQISPEERARMFLEYNQARDRQSAIREAKLEIAHSMLARGMTISLISEITGLTEAEIREEQRSRA